jgi:RNA polymerase sigma factor (sigma-70 family)
MAELHAFFAYRLGSRADAEDLTQETLERAFRAWARYDPARASARTWLLAIARNLLIDHQTSVSIPRSLPRSRGCRSVNARSSRCDSAAI